MHIQKIEITKPMQLRKNTLTHILYGNTLLFKLCLHSLAECALKETPQAA